MNDIFDKILKTVFYQKAFSVCISVIKNNPEFLTIISIARLPNPLAHLGKFVAATSREGLISERTKRFPSRLKRPTILRVRTMKVLLQSLFIRFLKGSTDLKVFVRKQGGSG